jgi:hypothetical protein
MSFAALAHLAEGLCLRALLTLKVEKSLNNNNNNNWGRNETSKNRLVQAEVLTYMSLKFAPCTLSNSAPKFFI